MKRAFAIILTMLLVWMLIPLQAIASTDIPMVVVKSFKATPSRSEPGEAFSLEIILKNQGKKDAKNVSLTIGSAGKSKADTSNEAGDTEFLPVESGNVIYINEIKEGKEKKVKLKLTSKSDTIPGIYDLDLTLNYSYSRLSFSTTAKIGLVVEQKESLVLKGLSYPGKIMLGDTAAITGDIVNISNGSLKAVTVDYAGENLEKTSEFYGIFEPNNSDSLDNTIKPEKAGIANVTVSVSFYDSFGKKQEIKRELSIQVQEPNTANSQTIAGQDNLDWLSGIIKFLFGMGG